LTLKKSIIKFIKDRDGFSWFLNDHENDTTSYIFWCNCRQELTRRQIRRDTTNYLNHFGVGDLLTPITSKKINFYYNKVLVIGKKKYKDIHLFMVIILIYLIWLLTLIYKIFFEPVEQNVQYELEKRNNLRIYDTKKENI
jgi:hypothetical protein